MIQIREEREPGGWRLTFSGHAGYSQGQDIVCAAVSILFFTLANRISERGDREEAAFFRSGEGRLFVPDGHERELSFVRCGLALLAEQYPDNVEVRA